MMVKAVADGKGDIVAVHVDPEVVDPTEVEMLEGPDSGRRQTKRFELPASFRTIAWDS